ncbi:MauE/DoxX family redox-associated membrane protein [Echinicola sp. 20G]|uniref:MauE/DoxX family redox-associated membrane protein n=1 Tax=Echinicola sp. 20G TaxID=2781961 RepID=UPI00191014E5|nr:MauE/DoxX family redox-associated membrane protein [Echinicola sp. 20G]
MNHQKSRWTEVLTYILAFVYTYTAISKWYDWEATKWSIYNQVFPEWSSVIVLYTLPAIELVLALLLLNGRTRLLALWISLFLLSIFTAYIGMIMLGVFQRVPCSCGGVISALGWNEHLVFNFFLLAANIWAIFKGKQNKEQNISSIP